MKTGERRLTLALVLGLSLLLAMTSGCGKNIMGPKAPTSSADSDTLMSEAEALQNYSAACHDPGRWIGPRGWVYEFLMNCTPAKILDMGNNVTDGYFTDPAVRSAIKRILTSKLFYLIMFNHGAGFLLLDTATQIVAKSWSPNAWDNPGNFPNKVTLFPFDWNTFKMFHGSLHAGWQAVGAGYLLQTTDPAGDYLHLQTWSEDHDIYQNNSNVYDFIWDYQYISANSVPAYLNNRLTYNLADNWVYTQGHETWLMDNGQGVFFDDIHFSTSDKSGRVNIYSAPANFLNLELDFNPDGSGTGSMDIKNVRGTSTHYDYSQAANGHGWWAKNGGKKHSY